MSKFEGDDEIEIDFSVWDDFVSRKPDWFKTTQAQKQTSNNFLAFTLGLSVVLIWTPIGVAGLVATVTTWLFLIIYDATLGK